MDGRKNRTRRRNDIVLTALLALFAAALLAFHVLNDRAPAAQVEIARGYTTQAVFPFGEEREWSWREGNAFVTVLSGAEGVRIAASSCPDQLCVKQGVLSRAGQSIVCLPNRVVVTLISRENPEIDAILR